MNSNNKLINHITSQVQNPMQIFLPSLLKEIPYDIQKVIAIFDLCLR